ncbi:uncharacterized protein LOC120411236 [Corvus cornix cornix]|uniref:uncharacterized protein LOC120411236 n=1 Tax=Corvus cornix cornix TaxID=932674 RepID=UPI00194DC581|nr:uncharacterized protein LOC120411236 [Corvus cornix cornix]
MLPNYGLYCNTTPGLSAAPPPAVISRASATGGDSSAGLLSPNSLSEVNGLIFPAPPDDKRIHGHPALCPALPRCAGLFSNRCLICCCQACGCASGRLRSTHDLRELCHRCASSSLPEGSCPLPQPGQGSTCGSAATGGGFPFLRAGVDSRLTPWFGTLRRGSNTALDQWARTGAQPRCSETAVPSGEEGTGRTCQAPAHTGLCSSGLQPGITESSSCGKTPGHGLPDSSRCESRLQQLPDLTHTGGPGAPARSCPSRNTGCPRTLSPARSAGWKGQGRTGRSCSSARTLGAAARCSAAPAVCGSIKWSGCCGLQDARGPCSLCKHRDHRGNVLTPMASA